MKAVGITKRFQFIQKQCLFWHRGQKRTAK